MHRHTFLQKRIINYELFSNFVAQNRKIVIYETTIKIFFHVDGALLLR